ncbi:MAG TPA: heme-degrading domain-containing protein [Blastococcus sp.]|nr:heme-degrading domain-containing protein [Blastococcus sp.]
MTASFPSVAELAAEEAELQFSSFTDDDAWELGAALRELARRQEAPVAIDISRNGHQLFHAALAGATPDNDAWIERKQRVVHRFGHSTLHVRQTFAERGTTFEQGPGLDPQRYAAHGPPVLVRSVGPVGIVVVSGLPQLEDHRLVVRALRAHLG